MRYTFCSENEEEKFDNSTWKIAAREKWENGSINIIIFHIYSSNYDIGIQSEYMTCSKKFNYYENENSWSKCLCTIQTNNERGLYVNVTALAGGSIYVIVNIIESF